MNNEVIRVVVGFTIIFASIVVATTLAQKREEERHARYVRCVSEGGEPMECSFRAVFE